MSAQKMIAKSYSLPQQMIDLIRQEAERIAAQTMGAPNESDVVRRALSAYFLRPECADMHGNSAT